jgi:hypothetical protein
MPLRERVQLARALAEKRGRRLSDADVGAWRPLLRFTQGNPLTITVTVGQALRDGLRTEEQIEAFVAQLRAGEARIEDEESEGRTRSLAASLSYGFEHAFDEQERKQLALLHLFQGFVDVQVLQQMGALETTTGEDYSLDEVRGLTREQGIALLDRAAEVGLLTAHGGGYYAIHPALPWYFRGLFEEHYSPTPTLPQEGREQISPLPLGEGAGVRATRAFVEAMGELGAYYTNEYVQGNRDVIRALSAEEANLLHARQLARAHGWWHRITSTMQGLDQLYDHTGRRAEWRRLVEEIVPDFVDPASGGPLVGREEAWSLVTDYRVRLAREARQWAEAERLQRARVDWSRQRAALALAAPPKALDDAQRNAIRTLAASLHELGEIQRELSQAKCVESYEESLALCEQIGEKAGATACAFNLGHAYRNLSAIRDLDQAERWYRRSLELHDEDDRLGRSRSLVGLGIVAFERFVDEKAASHFNTAVESYQQALALLPSDAMADLATTHNRLGQIYIAVSDLDRALTHNRESIRYLEMSGDLYGAGKSRGLVALALLQANRLAEAREYARAALRNFSTYGAGAAADVQET